METEFLNPQSLQIAIALKVKTSKISYIDAILEFCDEMDIDYENLPKLLTDNLKENIRKEYVMSGHLKETASLPF